MAWSPDGRLLAAVSSGQPGMVIWDVASRQGTAIRAGLAGVSRLQWSPCGGYLFAAGLGSNFYLWETSMWRFEFFNNAGAGRVVNAQWTADSSVSRKWLPFLDF